MSIQQAGLDQLEAVRAITAGTIREIYPHYYPQGAVNYFLAHHSGERIADDIRAGLVYLNIVRGQTAVGTITIRGNELSRLFVLPQYQGRGYGRELLEFAECRISECSPTAVLDASLPAKAIYLKRGYTEVETHSIRTENGDFLCCDVLQKSFRSPGAD